MTLFQDNPDFYPTPPDLAQRMADKIIDTPVKTLEPSAGKGDLINAINKNRSDGFYTRQKPTVQNIVAIEKDPNLRAILVANGAKPFNELTWEEKQVVNQFEGQKSYAENRKKQLLPSMLKIKQLEFKEAA